jgi:hypothetical protein
MLDLRTLAEDRQWLADADDVDAAMADIEWAAGSLFPGRCFTCEVEVATIADSFDWDSGSGAITCLVCGSKDPHTSN